MAARDHLRVGPVLEGHLELRGDRLLHRNLDVLTRFAAVSSQDGSDSCSRGVNASLVAGLMAESLKRGQLRMLGAAAVEHAYSARAPQRKIFGSVVAIWSTQAVGRDRSHDEGGVDTLQPVEIQSYAIHLWRRNVVHQNVGAGYQLLENPEALSSRNIKGDAALVSVEVKEQAALVWMYFVVGEWPAGS